MTIDNKPNAEEVREDKPEAKEVANSGPIVPEDIISDILQDQPVETKSEEESSPDPEEGEKTEEISPEKKEEEPNGEVFAKIGNREFKSQEELTNFVTNQERELSSQKGFNSWITGAVKRMRPDLFNEDGSIKTSDLQKIIEGASANAGKAAETMKELGTIPEDELTDEQKEDIQKAREILRPLGVVFADDPKLKKMEEDLSKYRERDFEIAQNVINEFSAKHSNCKKSDGTATNFDEHRVAIGELMEQRGYDNLEKAWKVYKAEQEITEENEVPNITKSDDSTKNKSVDTTIPTTVKKESGTLPTSGKKDIWDDVLSIRDI